MESINLRYDFVCLGIPSIAVHFTSPGKYTLVPESNQNTVI